MGSNKLLASLVPGSAIPVIKHGISGLVAGGDGNGCFFTSDFTEDNWDDLGNQDSNGGDDYSSTGIVSDKLRIIGDSTTAGQDSGAVAIREMSEGLGTSWNIRFNYTTGSSSTFPATNKNAYLWIGVTSDSTYTSSQGANNQSGDACFWRWHMNPEDKNIPCRTINGGSNTETSNAQANVSWVNSTVYYWELTYDNSTFSAKQFTNADYDTQTGTTTTVSDSGLTGMNYLLVGTAKDSIVGDWIIDVNEIKVANDTTEAC